MNNEVTHTYQDGPNMLERDWDITVTFSLDAETDGAAMPTPVVVEGAVTSCGMGCMRVVVGRIGGNYYRNLGNCGYRQVYSSVTIARPDLIESVKLVQVGMDDWIRVWNNNVLAYNADANWTYPGARCGENGSRGTRGLNIDVTSQFTTPPAGTSIPIGFDLSVADDGEGWAIWEFRSTEECRFETDDCPGGVTGGTGLTRVVKARAASRYDESDLSRSSGGAQDSVDEMDTRPPAGTTVPAAR